MIIEENKAKILEFLANKKDKTKFYFSDFVDLFPDMKQMDVKKILTALVQEQKLEFWSSGSTTMYGLAGVGKQHVVEENE
ncbi:Protein DsvD [Desulfovibrionales bacterium]